MKEKTSIVKGINIVVIVSALTKVIGLVKQMVISGCFGTTAETDAFLLVTGTINDIGSTLFSVLLIVFVADYIRLKSEQIKSSDKFTAAVIITFSAITVLVIILTECFALEIIRTIAPGFSKEICQLAAVYLQILAPVLLLICLRTVCNAILNAEKVFWYGKSLGIIQSGSLIIAVLLFGANVGLKALVYALIATYSIELIIGAIIVFRKKYYKITLPDMSCVPEIKNMLLATLPLFASNSLLEINAVVDRAIASSLQEGSVSALSYAQTLRQFVIVVFVTSTLTVFYTSLVQATVDNDEEKIGKSIIRSISFYSIVLIPITLATIFSCKEIVSIVYGRGAVTEGAVQQIATVLCGYAVGFLPAALNGIMQRAYYSVGDTKFPLIGSVTSVGVHVILAFIGAKMWGIIGISLATGVATIMSFLILVFGSRRRVVDIPWSNLNAFVIKIIISAVLTLGVLKAITVFIPLQGLILFVVNTVASITIFVLTLVVLRCNELKDFMTFALKFRRKKI